MGLSGVRKGPRHADQAAAKDASGETASSANDAVGGEHHALTLRLVHMRTACPNAMQIKAALVLNIWDGRAETFDHPVKRIAEPNENLEEPLCHSAMRDIVHQLGPEHRASGGGMRLDVSEPVCVADVWCDGVAAVAATRPASRGWTSTPTSSNPMAR